MSLNRESMMGREQAREPDSPNVTEPSTKSEDWQRLHQHLAPTERETEKSIVSSGSGHSLEIDCYRRHHHQLVVTPAANNYQWGSSLRLHHLTVIVISIATFALLHKNSLNWTVR